VYLSDEFLSSGKGSLVLLVASEQMVMGVNELSIVVLDQSNFTKCRKFQQSSGP
jgi:hypothetical protein